MKYFDLESFCKSRLKKNGHDYVDVVKRDWKWIVSYNSFTKWKTKYLIVEYVILDIFKLINRLLEKYIYFSLQLIFLHWCKQVEHLLQLSCGRRHTRIKDHQRNYTTFHFQQFSFMHIAVQPRLNIIEEYIVYYRELMCKIWFQQLFLYRIE